MKNNNFRFNGMCSIFIIYFLIMTPFFVGCGSSGGGDSSGNEGNNTQTPTTKGVTLSTGRAMPGEFLTVLSGAIKKGEPFELIIKDEKGYESVMEFAEALEDGLVEIIVQPYIDLETGEVTKGSVTVSIKGNEGEAILTVNELPEITGIEPGSLLGIMADETIASYKTALANLNTLAADPDETIDITPLIQRINDEIARLKTVRDEIATSNEIVIPAEGGDIVLNESNLAFMDRWTIALLNGRKARLEKALGIGSVDQALTLSLENPGAALTESQIRELIAEIQVRSGQVKGIDAQAMVIGAISIVSGAVGGGVNPETLTAKTASLVSASATTADIALSQSTGNFILVLTADTLNADRLRQEEDVQWWGNVAKITIVGGGILFAWLGPAEWAAVGGLIAVFTTATTVTEMQIAADLTWDVKLHIPADGKDFGEIRVFKPGAFSFPVIATSFVDDRDAKYYNVLFGGIQTIQGISFLNPGAWHVQGINVYQNKIQYGNDRYGFYNSARGDSGQGIPPIPAPSLVDFRYFFVRAEAADFSDPPNLQQSPRGSLNVKYVDGPVIFTFRISPSEFTPGYFKSGSQIPATLISIEGRITNGSTLPLSIYDLELEVAPGELAFDPLHESTGTPFIEVNPGEDKTFSIKDIQLDISTDFYGTQQTPRLVIDNDGANSITPIFWHETRSVQALSGKFIIHDPTGINNW